jgi:glucosamine--fructose-6-phosphate aminotransferase (isomerizing)
MRFVPLFALKHSFALAISQSGETADTLEALRFLTGHGVHTVALVNVMSSTMVRETKGALPTYAGPEVAVASTKAFSAQVAALYILAHAIALEKGLIDEKRFKAALDELLVVAEVLESAIDTYKREIIQKHAPLYAQFKQALFLGRHVSYPFAQEAALKLKEISYIFADSYPAAELKHGPLALVDAQMPTFIFSVLDPVIYQKMVSNVQEVKARQGQVIAFAFEGQKELVELADTSFVLPRVAPLLGPLAMTGLMQFFVYQIAKELGRPIDKPRNLAKSLTVE